MLVLVYLNIWQDIPEDSHLHNHCCENPKLQLLDHDKITGHKSQVSCSFIQFNPLHTTSWSHWLSVFYQQRASGVMLWYKLMFRGKNRCPCYLHLWLLEGNLQKDCGSLCWKVSTLTIILLVLPMQQLQHDSLCRRHNDDWTIFTAHNQATLLREIDACCQSHSWLITRVL